MDPEEAGDIGSAATGGEHPENLGLLVCQELRTPSALSAALAGRPQTGAGSLPDHGALELGEGPKHLHHHASGRTGGVDRLCQGAEGGARRVDLLQDMQQILERAGQAVEFPDDESIAVAQMVEEAV